jgi:hypothetical protein
MFNTISNLSRKTDKYGDIHFISFLGSTLARLAYMDDNKFLTNYNKIVGPVIQPQILQGINNVESNNLSALLDDELIFGLKNQENVFSNYQYDYKGKKFVDFIGLNMPQNINIINGDLSGNISYPVPGQETQLDTVKYISIGWSNYGEIYVVADKRMPNTLFLIFRGTYNAKTAAIYINPTSIFPVTVCKDSKGEPEQFLYGIFKPTSEMIHTIIEAMNYLATDFLGATKPNSVKIFTTGHSLGGAMCSIFAYLWMGIKKTAPYNTSPYDVLADNIICISLGAPRCMGSSVAKKFCNFVSQKKILFLRITTRGDPIPGLPVKMSFQHPCSDDSEMRKVISEDCNSTLTMKPTPNVNYNANLDCQNYKTRTYMPNMLSHTIYLDILYTKAVDISKFLKGVFVSQEVSRGTDGSTICRLIMGENSTYKTIFFDVNKSRETPTSTDQENANQPPADLTATFTEQENANQTPADSNATPGDQENTNQPADSNATPGDQENANQHDDSNATPGDQENANQFDDSNATHMEQSTTDLTTIKSDKVTNEQELAKSLTNVVDYITDVAAKKVSAGQLGDKEQNGFDTVNAVAKTMANSGGKKIKSRKLKLTNKNKTRYH